MLDRYSENAMLTKALAMYGKRLCTADYTELLRKRTVAEIASYLKSTPAYADALKSLTESTTHRGRLEMLLQRELFERCARLSRYDTVSNGSFFQYIIRQGEVDEILRLIMFLNANDPEGFIADIPAFLVQHASFDLMGLARVRSFAELIEMLQGTPYAMILKEQGLLNGGQADYTACEVALYTYIYINELENIRKHHRGKTQKQLLKLVQTDIELKNISTIYRARVLFQKTPAETEKMLFPIWNRLHAEPRSRLLLSEDADTFSRQLRNTYYGKYMDKNGMDDSDRFAQRVKFLVDKQAIRFSADPSCTLYAFMTLCRIELFNITNIIEGVRYGVAAADLQKLLVTD